MAEKRTYTKRNATPVPIAPNEFGKLPPQAPELEEAILGAIMIEKDAYSEVSDLLDAESFYKPAHQKIYEAISKLAMNQEPIDMHTVTEQLRKNGTIDDIGGPYYITLLTAKVSSAAHLEYHARIVAQKYLARELIRISTDIQNNAFDNEADVDDVIFEASSQIEKLQEITFRQTETQTLSEVLNKSIAEMYVRKSKHEKGEQTGINTGLFDLNRTTGGWQKGDLIVLAGRPSMGKTALMLHFAKSASKHGTPVVVFELEMTDVKLADRLLISESNVCPNNYKLGKLTPADIQSIEKAGGILEKYPILIDGNRNATMDYIRNRSRLLKKQGKCEMVVIDYLGLVEAQGKKNSIREQEVADMSRKALLLAKELNVPVILLSQLSRKVEERANKKPILSDLRESGAIEQDADVVIFIYRGEYYNKNAEKGVGNLIIAKCRNGEVGEIDFAYNESMTRIFDYVPRYQSNIPPALDFNETNKSEQPF